MIIEQHGYSGIVLIFGCEIENLKLKRSYYKMLVVIIMFTVHVVIIKLCGGIVWRYLAYTS